MNERGKQPVGEQGALIPMRARMAPDQDGVNVGHRESSAGPSSFAVRRATIHTNRYSDGWCYEVLGLLQALPVTAVFDYMHLRLEAYV